MTSRFTPVQPIRKYRVYIKSRRTGRIATCTVQAGDSLKALSIAFEISPRNSIYGQSSLDKGVAILEEGNS